jgi:hypothetical protein
VEIAGEITVLIIDDNASMAPISQAAGAEQNIKVIETTSSGKGSALPP